MSAMPHRSQFKGPLVEEYADMIADAFLNGTPEQRRALLDTWPDLAAGVGWITAHRRGDAAIREL